ncbi:MAG: hypothetical protein ACLRWP_01525 [Bilophila wadsworthia]
MIGGIGGSRALDAAFISLTLAAAAETETSPLPYSRLPSRSVH